MKKVFDLTWIRSLNIQQAIDDICMNAWEINDTCEDIKIKLLETHFRELAYRYAQEINGNLDIFDRRTRGGKYISLWESTWNPSLKHIYETDFGSCELICVEDGPCRIEA